VPSAVKEQLAIKSSSPLAASFAPSEFSNAWVGFRWIDMSNLLPEIT